MRLLRKLAGRIDEENKRGKNSPDLSGICTTVTSLGLKIAGVLESLKILKGKIFIG